MNPDRSTSAVLGRISMALVFFILASCSSGLARPAGTTAAPTISEDPVGRFDVGGCSLYVKCLGQGSPTLILEAGAFGTVDDWSDVQPELAGFTRGCAYDRAGLGSSDARSSDPATFDDVASELHALLVAADIEPPYVMVAHSVGGFSARLFAHRYPDEVDGAVLVDSAYEDQVGVLVPKNLREGEGTIDLAASADELRHAGQLGDIPLVVLTHGRPIGPSWKEVLWSKYQRALSRLSTDAVHAIATKAQHYIQQDEPDVVIAAVRAVWQVARSGGSLPDCGTMFVGLPVECL